MNHCNSIGVNNNNNNKNSNCNCNSLNKVNNNSHINNNNKSSFQNNSEKLRRRKNDKFSLLVEKEIPNYMKYFKEEAEKTLSEINNIHTKSCFYTNEFKYEELYLPDNSIINSRKNLNNNINNNININRNFENISNRNLFVPMQEFLAPKDNDQGNFSKIVKQEEQQQQLLSYENNKINHKDLNEKNDFRKNLVYVNNIKAKSNKPIGFDIHIKDADDSAFEKLIID